MAEQGHDDEWELVKENVQPLRQGRTMSSLTKALHSDPKDECTIKENQSAFELELRTYDGDDPLDVWYRYIKWTEQHFPKGGQNGHLPKLIEKCLQQFQADERYINDVRFIKLWIIFSSFSESATDVFAYMFDTGIGVKVSQFYIEWATTLELAGNKKRADGIYTEGLNRLAEPRDLLVQKQQQFQNRLVKNIKLEMESSVPETEEGENRAVLSQLKPSGTRHKVGTTRTGSIVLGSAGQLKDQRGAVAPRQVPSKGFAIFTDENVPQQPQQTNEWVSMPKKSVDSKENERKPGVWTGAKIHQGHVAREAPSSSGLESFKIFEDPAQVASATPMKTTLMNHKPLSAVKAKEPRDVESHFGHGQGVPNLNEGIPMYPKDRIYQGMEEYSPEELRAIQYWKKVKAAQEEAERLRLEEERMKREAVLKAQVESQASELKAQADILAAQATKLASLEALVQFQIGGININKNSNPGESSIENCLQSSNELPQAGSSLSGQDGVEPSDVDMDVNGQSLNREALPAETSSNTKRNVVSARQENFNKQMKEAVVTVETSRDFITPTNLSGICPGKPSSSSSGGSNQRTPIFNSLSTYSSLASSGGSGSRNNSITVRKSSSGLNQSSHSMLSGLTDEGIPLVNNSSGSKNKMPLSAPSPTVCTKEAFQLVQGMFCAELDEESMMEEGTEPAPVKFAVYQDENAVPVSSSAAPSGASVFKIYQDAKAPLATSFGMASSNTEGDKYGGHLPFHVLEDVEMTDMERGQQDLTIAQAREDVTIAPLTNFTIKACAASTPFSGSFDKKTMKTTESMGEEVSLPSCGDTTGQSVEGAQTPFRHLSPILEGSGEGSSDDTNGKSHSQISTDSAFSAKKSGYHSAFSVQEVIPEETDERLVDESVCDDQPLDATCHHIIDTSACLPEETEALLSASVSIRTRDPFDKHAIDEYLSRLQPPLSSYENYHEMDETLNKVSENDIISVGQQSMEMIAVDKSLGQGGYAQVFKMYKQSLEDFNSQDFEAMKVQKPPCYWEFYIACEMQRRLTALKSAMDVRPSLMRIDHGYFNNDMSILVMKLLEHGALLNLVNLYKADQRLMGQVEAFACLVTIELLHLFEQLHKCDIIHGDVKPDNFLLMDLPTLPDSNNVGDIFGSRLRVFCLTDFGQTIDMRMFPEGTTFKTKVKTAGFECIEMRTDRPWTYQADLFGLAGTIHVLLFGSYMKVFVEKGLWKTTSSFVRKWNVPLWKRLFHELLNIPSCNCLPDLSALRADFEGYFCSNLVQPYNDWVASVQVLLNREGSLNSTKI